MMHSLGAPTPLGHFQSQKCPSSVNSELDSRVAEVPLQIVPVSNDKEAKLCPDAGGA
jgi:hypothetical protein